MCKATEVKKFCEKAGEDSSKCEKRKERCEKE